MSLLDFVLYIQQQNAIIWSLKKVLLYVAICADVFGAARYF